MARITLSVAEFVAEHPQIVARIEHYVPDLTEGQLDGIVNLIANTCKHCWNNNAGCQCWNDE